MASDTPSAYLHHHHLRYSSPPPTRHLHHSHYHRQQHRISGDHEELTPPCSPPTSGPHITSHVTLINNNPECSNNESDEEADEEEEEEQAEDSNETVGLDLTLKKEPKSEENEVSMTMLALSGGGGEMSHHRLPPPPPTAAAAVTAAEDFYRNRPAALIAASQFPYIVPSLPFLSRMPLPPHTSNTSSSFTEHLFKLASISRPMQVVHAAAAASPSAGGAQDLSAPLGVALSSPSPSGGPPPPSHHPHTVLSAMLGHHHRPVPVPGSVFPVFGSSVLPTSMFPQHPLPPRTEERPSSPITSTGELFFLTFFL
jgi:hypothetical protein